MSYEYYPRPSMTGSFFAGLIIILPALADYIHEKFPIISLLVMLAHVGALLFILYKVGSYLYKFLPRVVFRKVDRSTAHKETRKDIH